MSPEEEEPIAGLLSTVKQGSDAFQKRYNDSRPCAIECTKNT